MVSTFFFVSGHMSSYDLEASHHWGPWGLMVDDLVILKPRVVLRSLCTKCFDT